jgi:2-polyprenyl-3-methyl-5-hydroxy-6-metoxy-1,4-benzoquinol methylase
MRIFGITFSPTYWRRTLSRRDDLYTGYISERLAGLFDVGIDYAGKSILDVGCSIGLIAYEISKTGPKSIHGIDRYKPAIETARRIFRGVEAESIFDAFDLASRSARQRFLKPRYDIVLFLCVWHQLKYAKGPEIAAEIVHDLAGRCTEYFVARTPEEEEREFSAFMETLGFKLARESPATYLSGNSPLPTHVAVYQAPSSSARK